MALPSAGAFAQQQTVGAFQTNLENQLAAIRQLPGATAPIVTPINSGRITANIAMMFIETEGLASSDDLEFIDSSMPSGAILWLAIISTARQITLKHTGTVANGIWLPQGQDYTITQTNIWYQFRRSGAYWAYMGSTTPIGGLVAPGIPKCGGYIAGAAGSVSRSWGSGFMTERTGPGVYVITHPVWTTAVPFASMAQIGTFAAYPIDSTHTGIATYSHSAFTPLDRSFCFAIYNNT